jgi:hypothetical protein
MFSTPPERHILTTKPHPARDAAAPANHGAAISHEADERTAYPFALSLSDG